MLKIALANQSFKVSFHLLLIDLSATHHLVPSHRRSRISARYGLFLLLSRRPHYGREFTVESNGPTTATFDEIEGTVQFANSSVLSRLRSLNTSLQSPESLLVILNVLPQLKNDRLQAIQLRLRNRATGGNLGGLQLRLPPFNLSLGTSLVSVKMAYELSRLRISCESGFLIQTGHLQAFLALNIPTLH